MDKREFTTAGLVALLASYSYPVFLFNRGYLSLARTGGLSSDEQVIEQMILHPLFYCALVFLIAFFTAIAARRILLKAGDLGRALMPVILVIGIAVSLLAEWALVIDLWNNGLTIYHLSTATIPACVLFYYRIRDEVSDQQHRLAVNSFN